MFARIVIGFSRRSSLASVMYRAATLDFLWHHPPLFYCTADMVQRTGLHILKPARQLPVGVLQLLLQAILLHGVALPIWMP